MTDEEIDERADRILAYAQEKKRLADEFLSLKEKCGGKKAYETLSKTYLNEKLIPMLNQCGYSNKEISEITKISAGSVHAIIATSSRQSYDPAWKASATEDEKKKILKEVNERLKTGEVGVMRDGKFVKMSFLIGEKYNLRPDVVAGTYSKWSKKHPTLRKRKDKMERKLFRLLNSKNAFAAFYEKGMLLSEQGKELTSENLADLEGIVGIVKEDAHEIKEKYPEIKPRYFIEMKAKDGYANKTIVWNPTLKKIYSSKKEYHNQGGSK
jgi:hypothetical protein